MEVANTPAYYDIATITAAKSYIVQPRANGLAYFCATPVTKKQNVLRRRWQLKKFRVVDNPHKFALYVRRGSDSAKAPSSDTLTANSMQNTLGRVRMRRLNDAEQPLMIALAWKLSKFG